MTILSLSIGIGILIFYDFFEIFFDKNSLEESFWVCLIILSSVIIRSMMGPKKEFSNQCGLQKNAAVFQVLILIITIILNLILIRQIGILGAAISVAVIAVFEYLYFSYIVKNQLTN